MDLDSFYHICRAVASITNATEVTAFGSASILPYLHEKGIDSMAEFTGSSASVTREVDITVYDERLDTLVDGSIGELTMFDETYGYYAHGAGIDVATFPADWKARARNIPYEFMGGRVTITVPHPHDTMIAKLAAGREKDFHFAAALLRLFPISRDDVCLLKEKAVEAHKDREEQIETDIRRFVVAHPELFETDVSPARGPCL